MRLGVAKFGDGSRIDWKRWALRALRVSPWVTFGPITGILTERAIRCHARGDRVLAGMYVVLNVVILLSLPLVTASLASRL
jgi:hypothetical protein